MMSGGVFDDAGRSSMRKVRREGIQRDDDKLEEKTTKALTDAGLFVAKGGIGRKSEGSTFALDGDLAEFTACALKLGIQVVFLEPLFVDEDDFLGATAIDDDEQSVDLRAIEPKLRDFEKYMDCCEMVEIVGCFGNNYLSFIETTAWAKEMHAFREKAIACVDASSGEASERLERERERRESQTIERIRALAGDAAFKDFMGRARQPFESIVAYMRENVEGAGDLRPGALRDEARALRGKLLLDR
jgi:hypothetical protein